MISRKQSEADLALAEKATMPPWEVHPDKRYYVLLPTTEKGDSNRDNNAAFTARARTALPLYAKALMEAMELLDKVLSSCSRCNSTGEITKPSENPQYQIEIVDCPECIVPMREAVAAYHAQEKA